jgi:hypothetical protein
MQIDVWKYLKALCQLVFGYVIMNRHLLLLRVIQQLSAPFGNVSTYIPAIPFGIAVAAGIFGKFRPHFGVFPGPSYNQRKLTASLGLTATFSLSPIGTISFTNFVGCPSTLHILPFLTVIISAFMPGVT